MAKLNGRRKGARGEREVASILQDWWRKVDCKAEFCRTPLSGGWQTGSVRDHFKAGGDIMTTASNFPFTVEVKYREQWSVDFFMKGRPTPVWAWWRQTLKAANDESGVPMMWLRKTRLPRKHASFPWLVLVPFDYYREKKLKRPDIIWDAPRAQLRGVDFGGVIPVGYIFTKFLEMPAARFKTVRDAE